MAGGDGRDLEQPQAPARSPAPAPEGARARILDAAYRLFSRHGIQAVGIERIIAEAGIAKATLYHHFASKEDLVLAFLQLREERWTRGWLQAEAERLAAIPRQRALAVFDALATWFRRPDYEGCSFIRTLLEIDDNDEPVRREAIRHLGVLRALLDSYAEQAGAADSKEAGHQLHMLVIGAIVSTSQGEDDAAQRARALAELLLDGAR